MSDQAIDYGCRTANFVAGVRGSLTGLRPFEPQAASGTLMIKSVQEGLQQYIRLGQLVNTFLAKWIS
jgi:hypothetical protein